MTNPKPHVCRPIWLACGEPPRCVLPEHWWAPLTFAYPDVKRDVR